jgi:hydantoinase/carbamoylase family amidase
MPVPVGTHSNIHEQLDELAAFNSNPKAGGVTREVFTPEYLAASNYVSELMTSVGLETRSDAFGNLFGRLTGSEPERARVLTGSHIDTTLNAGRYDGTLGVLGAVEAVRALVSSGAVPRRTIEVVCLAGEEPRFGTGCLGSRALTGALSRADLDATRDRDGVTLAEALDEYGLDPDRIDDARVDVSDIHAFVELHIEQGAVLEREQVPIGVVTHITAPHDLLVRITGEAAHAGATPMGVRRDALAGAAEAVTTLERLATEAASGTAVATVGVVRVRPGAINVIPGEVALEVDIRDRDAKVRTELVDRFLAELKSIAELRGLFVDITTLARDEPIACHELVVDAARHACEGLGIPCLAMISGAYHDALVLGAQLPAGMIFVPSSAGVSHSPDEYTPPQDIERGVAVLAQTLAELAGTG